MRKLFALPLVLAASIAFASPAFASGVTPGAATPVQREQAQSRFVRGKEKFGKGQFEAAHVEFSASFDLVASPNTRLYLARCEEKMGKLVAAYVSFDRTEVEAKELAKDDSRYDKAGQSAHEERIKLGAKLGFVDISIANADPKTVLRVAGEEVRRGGWSEPVPMAPGKSEVVVETPGRAAVTRTVEIAAGEKKSLAIDANEGALAQTETPPEPVKPKNEIPYRTMAYVAGGVAVVGLGMFTIFGLASNGTYSDLESACNNGPCPPGHEDDISTGKTQQTLANVGLVVFVVGAAAGVTLFVLDTKSKQGSTTTAKMKAGPSFVGLEGSF